MKTIKGYKAFEKGLICKGFKFRENEIFEIDESPVICESGFHFCENPLDILNYYSLVDSEFANVESIGEIDRNNDDSKICTNKIKIGLKIDLKTFIKASFDFIWKKCYTNKNDDKLQAASGNYSKLAASGDYSKLAASGYSSRLAASGDSSQLAASGDSSRLAASGDSSQLAASGNYSKLAASGNYSKLAASGDYSKLAASGDYSKLAASGDYSKLAASGNYSKLEITGQNCIAANIGIDGKIKGKKGTWITLAEYDKDNICIFVKTAKIDGIKIKEDTWYILKNKIFTEIN